MNNIINNQNGNGGIGAFGLLGVLFVGLKLGGVINWSWFYVTMPFWGGFVLGVGLIFLIAIAKMK